MEELGEEYIRSNGIIYGSTLGRKWMAIDERNASRDSQTTVCFGFHNATLYKRNNTMMVMYD